MSAAELWLSPEEVETLTGRKRWRAQCRQQDHQQGGGCAMTECERHGHHWSHKRVNGRTIKVCERCGVSEYDDAVSLLRRFVDMSREFRPSPWPGERVMRAIEVLLP